MGQRITVRDNGTPVYLGEGDSVGPSGRISYFQYVLDRAIEGIEQTHTITEDMDEDALICEGYVEEAYQELSRAYTWYEDGIAAIAMGVITREIAALFDTLIIKTIGTAAGKGLMKGAGSALLSRFKAYGKIYPEIIPISEFSKVNYDIIEATTRFKLKFKLAGKWAEKLNTRVSVRVYTRDKKPAFAIAYSDKSEDKTYNSEFVMIDNKYRKHLDFYTASAHADVGIMHPSIKRVIVDIRNEWKKLQKQNKRDINEAVEDAIAEGTYLEKRMNVVDAYNAGVITYEDADAYLDAMDLAGFDVRDDFMYEEIDDLLDDYYK